MTTLIDWSTLQTKIAAYSRLHGYTTASHALLHVVAETLLAVTPEEFSEGLTDGSRDRGIDAVLIQEDQEGAVVHLFQSKCVTDFDKASNNFPSNEIDKILSFVADLLARSGDLEQSANPLLFGRVRDIWDLFERGTPRFVVHLVSNQAALVADERRRLEASLSPYRYFTVEEHTLASIASLLIAAHAPAIDAELRLVDNQYFERVDGNIRGLVATVEASQVVQMIRDPENADSVRRSIFEENVRIYLGTRNRINRSILESALHESNQEFWYLNNGITITCEAMEYPPGVRGPLLRLHNPQIVNGGQTCNALFEASAIDSDRLKSALVLVRVYETRRREMSLRISESTNSQTPIRSRDLRANDIVQRKLEEQFASLGYFYERKTNQHYEQPKPQRIDCLAAAQAYVAYYLGEPSVAGKDRGRIFGDMYDSVFNDELTAHKLLSALAAFEPVLRRKADLQRALREEQPYDPDDLFLIDGAYHLLYAVSRLCLLRGIDLSDTDQATSLLKEARTVLLAAIAIEAADPAHTLKRFFKSTRSKQLIEQRAARVGAAQSAPEPLANV